MRRGLLAAVVLSSARSAILLAVLVAVTGTGCSPVGTTSPAPPGADFFSPAHQSVSGRADVFTPAHRTIVGAARDYFGIRTPATQPIEFPHNVHVQKGLTCTDYCHENASRGPVAGIPSVKTCMICHEAIATDRPRVQRVAEFAKRQIEIPWARVYNYPSEAHVSFQHAPHIRASVACATCHGDIAGGTVATRNVELNMGFCVNCHQAKQASLDCLTCHF